MVTRIAKSEYN